MSAITVIVPATNQPPTLGRCLDAIAAGDRVPDELIVVTEPVGGPAAARNAGAARAGGDVLVFVDADVVVAGDALARIEAALADGDGPDAVFGSYDDRPEATGVVSRFRNLLHHHVHTSAPGPATTFWAGLGAIRRAAFERSGGFDAERYPLPSIEDIELGVRMHAGGARIVLDPAIRGTHLKRWTLSTMVETDFARRGLPWVALLLEQGASSALNLGGRHRASAALSALAAAATVARRPRPLAAALAGLVALNTAFYALLVRRLGPAGAIAGIGLHVVHHLTALAAVPVGVLLWLRRGR